MSILQFVLLVSQLVKIKVSSRHHRCDPEAELIWSLAGWPIALDFWQLNMSEHPGLQNMSS